MLSWLIPAAYAAVVLAMLRSAAWTVARYNSREMHWLYPQGKPSELDGDDWFIVAIIAVFWPLTVAWKTTRLPRRMLRWYVTHEPVTREQKAEQRLRERKEAIKAAEKRLAEVNAELDRLGLWIVKDNKP